MKCQKKLSNNDINLGLVIVTVLSSVYSGFNMSSALVIVGLLGLQGFLTYLEDKHEALDVLKQAHDVEHQIKDLHSKMSSLEARVGLVTSRRL
jgi:hypothetical protein